MIQAGDLVIYTLNNDFGKVKRIGEVQGKSKIFVWYHCGDTASCTPKHLLELIMTADEASKYKSNELCDILRKMNFNNSYAIKSIIKKEEVK